MSSIIRGWVDLQVNGFKGIDFSSPKLALEDIHFVSKQLLAQGIVGYCPTVISAPLKVYKHNLPLLAAASESSEGAQILGIHLEGPFINREYGPRGAHPEDCIISPSIEVFEQLRSWAQDKLVILTLAPECAGAFDLIQHVVTTSKIIISMGHLTAGADTIQKAVELGARAATHVGNGIADMLHRHDNPLWPILANDRVTGFFITDGNHLPPELVRVCLRAKGSVKFIVTSDMSCLAGLAPGEYDFHGIHVVLNPDGAIRRKGTLQHAGAGVTMMEDMNFMASLGELDLPGLLKVGFENSLQLLGAKIDKERQSKAPKILYERQRFVLQSEL
jgi:N-acetylglucosamine-6-phosphate deacetylase